MSTENVVSKLYIKADFVVYSNTALQNQFVIATILLSLEADLFCMIFFLYMIVIVKDLFIF